jgi:hypothetical protein
VTVQQQAFKVYYSSLTDAELMKIAANKRSFIGVAQEALTNELSGRHLAVSEPERPAEARRGGLVRRLLAIVGLVVAGTSCSSGPALPQPGTPAFYWSAARETYKAGDFIKTSENLQRILASENEYTARARAWDTVITAGLAQGYIDLADAYEAGARANRANPTPFRKQVSTLRSQASQQAIQFTEDLHRMMEVDKDPTLLLAFVLPAGAMAQPAALKRVSGGIVVQDSERDQLELAMLQRGVLMSVCAQVGSADDSAAAQEKLKSGEFKVPRETFLLAAAKRMQDQSDLFTGTKLDQPRKLKLLCDEALAALHAVPETKETKALTEKIKARMKKANLT